MGFIGIPKIDTSQFLTSENTAGNTLFVNPLNSNASDAWTRAEALGRSHRPFATINAAWSAATSNDLIYVMSNVTVSIPLPFPYSRSQKNIFIAPFVTVTATTDFIFTSNGSSGYVRIYGAGKHSQIIASDTILNLRGWKRTHWNNTFQNIYLNATRLFYADNSGGVSYENVTAYGEIVSRNWGGNIRIFNSRMNSDIAVNIATGGQQNKLLINNSFIDGSIVTAYGSYGDGGFVELLNSVCSGSFTKPSGTNLLEHNFEPNIPFTF